MNKKSCITILAILFSLQMMSAQEKAIAGVWQTIDDNTQKPSSHVTIYKDSNGIFYGKVIKLIGKPGSSICENCEGKLKNKPILGMVIMTNMKKDGNNKISGGKILDPENGNLYYCSATLDEDNPDKLHLRGSLDKWGFAGRTQIWHRIK